MGLEPATSGVTGRRANAPRNGCVGAKLGRDVSVVRNSSTVVKSASVVSRKQLCVIRHAEGPLASPPLLNDATASPASRRLAIELPSRRITHSYLRDTTLAWSAEV